MNAVLDLKGAKIGSFEQGEPYSVVWPIDQNYPGGRVPFAYILNAQGKIVHTFDHHYRADADPKDDDREYKALLYAAVAIMQDKTNSTPDNDSGSGNKPTMAGPEDPGKPEDPVGEKPPAEEKPKRRRKTNKKPAAHALLSASSAHRWINCPPSARQEEHQPDTAGDAAKEGTEAHALAEHKIRKALGEKTRKPRAKYRDQAMEDHTDDYQAFVLEKLAAVRQTCPDAEILLEQRLDFSDTVPEGFGTGDCVIIAEPTLTIIDFKYGTGVKVSAEGNPQMMLYALGALVDAEMLYDIAEVEMIIYQPRIGNVDTHTITVDELHTWADTTVAPAARLAFDGAGDYQAGSWCQFCKIKNTCRARAVENLAIAQREFAPTPELTEQEIVEILTALPALKTWIKDVESYTYEQATVHKRTWPGFKLVAGRGKRVFTDTDQVLAVAREAGKPDDQLFTQPVLISLTKMETLFGKKNFAELFKGLVVKDYGRPQLVPESDPRRPWEEMTAEEDFAT